MRREGSITGTLGFILFGPIVWALHLLVAYGAHASMCAVAGPSPGALPWILGGATIVAAAALTLAITSPDALRRLFLGPRPERGEVPFEVTLMRLLSLLALIGVLLAAIVMLVLPLCVQAR